jgi:hypothetical protein
MIVNTNESTPISSIQMKIDNDRKDLRMFNALLECDILEAYGEHGIIALTEDAKEGGFKAKMNALVEFVSKKVAAFVEFLKDLRKKLKAALEKVADNFNAMIAEKTKDITVETARTLEGDVSIPDISIMVTLKTEVDKISQAIKDKDISSIDRSGDAMERNNNDDADANYEEKIKNLQDQIYITKKYSEINNSDIAIIRDNMGSGFRKTRLFLEDSMIKDENSALKLLHEFKQECNKHRAEHNENFLKALNDGDSEGWENFSTDTFSMASNKAENLKSILLAMDTMYKSMINIIKKWCSTCRSELLQMHTAAIKKVEVNPESAIYRESVNYMIKENSDEFIDKCFRLCC